MFFALPFPPPKDLVFGSCNTCLISRVRKLFLPNTNNCRNELEALFGGVNNNSIKRSLLSIRNAIGNDGIGFNALGGGTIT